MSNIWFTSDLHISHQRVSELRGYASPMDHDAALAATWRDQVADDDQVWVLGDVKVTRPQEALRFLAELPGIKHLVAGNHDEVHPMHRRAHCHQKQWLEVFDSVQAFAKRRITGHDVLLSHFPYSADRGPARYTQYRLRDEGTWLLHGHTHGPEKVHGHEIHVGLDAWGRLVDINEIGRLIAEAEEARPSA